MNGWTNINEEIKDGRSIITWCAAHRLLSFQLRCPSDREHSQQGVLAKSQSSCWKTHLTLRRHLVPMESICFSSVPQDSSQCRMLINPSCSWTPQLGTSFLAWYQSRTKGFAGLTYVCVLTDHYFPSNFCILGFLRYKEVFLKCSLFIISSRWL